MRGILRKLPDGTLTARLTDPWGCVYTLTGVKSDAGYEVEIVLTQIPEDLWLPGDEDWFEVAR